MVIAGFTLPLWIYPLLVWTLVWKGMALWKAGRNSQLPWFIIILILNTAGILPIIYLIWFQKDMNEGKVLKAVRKVKRKIKKVSKKVKGRK